VMEEEEEEENEVCPVCLEVLAEDEEEEDLAIFRNPCRHGFHQ